MSDLPPGLVPRVLTKAQAAAYCGIKVDTMSDWIARGLIPGPLPGTARWDRADIDRHLDMASGINQQSETELARADILRRVTNGL